LNIIKNGYFDLVNPDGTATFWGGWGGAAGSAMPQIIDGVAVCTPAEAAEVWQYQFNQQNLTALPDIPYIFKFKAWADADRTFNVDFEDTSGNGYNRYGATTDERSGDGRSDWTFDVTTEPTWYMFDVVFDQMVPSTIQKVQFMLGTSAIVTYLDSVLLVTEEEYYTVSVPPSKNAVSNVKVYPNPVGSTNVLTIDLPSQDSKITIYDCVGRRIEEMFETGDRAFLNVSSYANGIYFVKVNNEPVVKFMK